MGLHQKKYEVESRNNKTEQQWTALSAELKAAQTNQKLFEEFVKRVKEKTVSEKTNEEDNNE